MNVYINDKMTAYSLQEGELRHFVQGALTRTKQTHRQNVIDNEQAELEGAEYVELKDYILPVKFSLKNSLGQTIEAYEIDEDYEIFRLK
jgi:hypothetical protein